MNLPMHMLDKYKQLLAIHCHIVQIILYYYYLKILKIEINPVRRELTFFVSKSCDPDFKQAVKRHRVGTLVGC